MILFVFGMLAVLSIYPYVLYPVVITLWSRLSRRPWIQRSGTPGVSVIISAFNEERVIGEKVENSLALDYPTDHLEVLVASDGSTDRTVEIVRSCRSSQVRLIEAPQRQGKTACLNQAVPVARGEILVFTDANARLPEATLRHLVRHFADPTIGLVTGWTKYAKRGQPEATTGLYARLERLTKEAESGVSSCVGADGAIFAVRRELIRPLRTDDINDFVIPLDVIDQGMRVVLDADVYCVEDPAEGDWQEFRRQARITSRTIAAIARRPGFLNPASFGSFAIFLLSHKVLRFLVPYAFVGSLAVASILVAIRGILNAPVATGWVAAQLVVILMGFAGMVFPTGGRSLQISKYFLLTLGAQVVGCARWIGGAVDVTWKPER